MMVFKTIIYIFMISVYCISAYYVVREFFGSGRTGNYLKIRNKKDIIKNPYRILPLYKLILKKLKILYIISLILHLFLPLFYALSFTVLILLSDKIDWWEKDTGNIKVSVIFLWSEAGYNIKIYLLIVALSVVSLIIINIIFFPVVFGMIKKVFEVLI